MFNNDVQQSDWGERSCNVKYYAFFDNLSMKTYASSTPQKQNQDFVKGHNRT